MYLNLAGCEMLVWQGLAWINSVDSFYLFTFYLNSDKYLDTDAFKSPLSNLDEPLSHFIMIESSGFAKGF